MYLILWLTPTTIIFFIYGTVFSTVVAVYQITNKIYAAYFVVGCYLVYSLLAETTGGCLICDRRTMNSEYCRISFRDHVIRALPQKNGPFRGPVPATWQMMLNLVEP